MAAPYFSNFNEFFELSLGNSTHTTNSTSDIPEFWGFITAGIAIVFFGTNFIPVKKFDTGDGK